MSNDLRFKLEKWEAEGKLNEKGQATLNDLRKSKPTYSELEAEVANLKKIGSGFWKIVNLEKKVNELEMDNCNLRDIKRNLEEQIEKLKGEI